MTHPYYFGCQNCLPKTSVFGKPHIQIHTYTKVYIFATQNSFNVFRLVILAAGCCFPEEQFWQQFDPIFFPFFGSFSLREDRLFDLHYP